MPNYIQYSTQIPSGSLKKGNAALGITNEVTGPTSTTGWYSGINPQSGSYVIYEVAASGDPDIYCPQNATELLNLVKSKGATGGNTGSVAAALAWIATQPNLLAVNEIYPNIVTSGSVLNLDAALVGSYPVTGSTWYDVSGKTNNGILINNPTFNSGSGGIILDGIDDYINQNYYTATDFVNNQSWTIDTLINVVSSQSAGNTRGGVLTNQKFQTETDPGGFGLNIINQLYVINLTSGSTGNAITNENLAGVAINYNKNERITAIYDSSTSTAKIYRNGVLINSTTNAAYKWSTRSSGQSQYIGTSTQGGWTYYFPMKLYNASIYNRALSQAEILQNYYQAPIITDGLVFAVDAGNLVSYESGSTSTYSMTGSVSGSLINGVNYNSGNGGNWVFDGVDDFINLPLNSAFNTPSVTFEVWANLQTINDRHILYVNWQGNALEVNSDRSVVMFNYSSQGQQGSTTNANVFNWDTWTHFVGIYDDASQTLRTYVNGVLLATRASTPSTIYSVGVHKISGTDYGGEVKGKISITRHYNRALSADEILQNFNAQKTRFGL